jgi:endonuclease YncB( thermonuclease family)
MKKLLPILILLVSFTAFAGTPARISKISDGDTFHILQDGKDITLRLIWIDTPEKFNSKKLEKDAYKCGVDKSRMIKLGNLATSYAKQYFKDSKNIEVDFYGKGYYQRSLAVVYKRGSEIPYNFDIIADGYACIYKKEAYPKQLLDVLLERAKSELKGLWGVDYNVMKCLCGE